MVSPKKPPSEASTPPAGRRRRPAPTIDLTATEVEAAPAAEQAAVPADDPPPHSEAPAAEATTSQQEERPRGTRRGAMAWIEMNLTPPIVAAGCIGGGVVGLIALALWLATPSATTDDAGARATQQRVAALEQQLRDVQNRPVPAGSDAKALGALSQRLDKLEQAATHPATDSVLVARVEGIETALKALGITLTALNRHADEAAAAAADAGKRADAAAKSVSELQSAAPASSSGVDQGAIDAINKRVTELEQATKAIEQKVEKPSADPAARLAATLAALRTAAFAGEPFATLIDAAKSLDVDAQQLAALEPFAATGIPSASKLASELTALIPALMKSANANAPRDGTFLERLQANASHLVRIRPVDAPQGDDAGAIIARIEIKVAGSDLSGATAELTKLPPQARAPADAWLKTVQARQAALDASRKLAVDAFRALGNRTP
ncbi:MAG TPA: hypothetical protein VFB45_11860 [Pseudolabrys sp.]|nr:hypothetical protein [Pseudolabrys sp.]